MPMIMIIFLGLLVTGFVLLILLSTMSNPARSIARTLLGILLLLLGFFCIFGFLASFEYPGITAWKIGYAIAFAVFIGTGTWCLFKAWAGVTGKSSD